MIINEPPVVTTNKDNNSYDYASVFARVGKLTKALSRYRKGYGDNDNSWYPLYDTLSLAKVVFPDILQLINLDDYKGTVMELLTTMVDSGYVTAKDYEPYASKFYIEAKQELKKEKANESQKAIAKAEKANKADSDDDDGDNGKDNGSANELLQSYEVLLLPNWDKNPGIATFFGDVMKLKNKQIRFNTMLLLLRNKKPVADSLMNFYAADEDFCIDLYRALKKAKMLDKFPAKYNNQADLVKSAIVGTSAYDKYDTLALLDKMPSNL